MVGATSAVGPAGAEQRRVAAVGEMGRAAGEGVSATPVRARTGRNTKGEAAVETSFETSVEASVEASVETSVQASVEAAAASAGSPARRASCIARIVPSLSSSSAAMRRPRRAVSRLASVMKMSESTP